MGMPPTGCSRRESYAFAPTSRMHNTFIAPGSDDEQDMIATMGNGLFAKKMGGGSVDPATGNFNFAVLEGYLVKDGKITTPVRGASLIGKRLGDITENRPRGPGAENGAGHLRQYQRRRTRKPWASP